MSGLTSKISVLKWFQTLGQGETILITSSNEDPARNTRSVILQKPRS